MDNLTVSIITVSFNSVSTISDTINSVLAQTYKNIEYIIIDGSSTDGTVELIRTFGKKISTLITEPDNGIYDAINKGIRVAKGDIIGILNSDDFLYDKFVIEKVVKTFTKNDIDAIIGDVQFVDPDKTDRVKRYYSSKYFHPGKFRYGFMPAHPSFYAKKDLYNNLGLYKTDYEIAADYELLIRFLYINKVKYKYIEMPLVSMRTGGVSNKSLHSNYILNKEIVRACKENGIYTNSLLVYSKYFIKILELFGNRNK